MGTVKRSQSPDRAPAQAQAVQGRQYLTFSVAGEAYAIPISSIKEIIEYRRPTDVPMMPGYMRGVINLRGRVVPVIDLAVRFARAAGEVSRRTCIVILEIEEQGELHDIGVVVDAVNAVLAIADADVEPAPAFGAGLRTDFISGMGRIDDRFAVILDIARVLSLDELATLVEPAVAPAGLPALPAPAPRR